jgi:thioredoxin-like negative regulator of GroEL
MMLRSSGWNPWLGQVALAGTQRRRLGDAIGLNDDTISQALNAPAAVVDFWSPTCLPCMKYKPVFEAVASDPPSGVFMATVNADEAPQTMAKFGIDSIPTTLFLANGQEVYRTQGIVQRQDLLDAIAKSFPPAAPAETSAPSSPPSDATAQAPTSTPSGAAQTVTPSQPVQPSPSGQAPRATPSTSAPSASKAAAAAAPSSGLSTTTIFIGGIALLTVTAAVVFLSRD